MASAERWSEAQQYQRIYWDGIAQQIAAGALPHMDWYRWRADQLVRRLQRLNLHRLTTGGARVVEIGCGPIGITSFFPGIERVAVDPLNDAYTRHPVFSSVRDPQVRYHTGVGERLPCPSGHYDLVIIENCIDHVQDVDAVMRELDRVLKPDGVVYLAVNNRSRPGYFVHRALSRLGIDREHPHTFTPHRTVELLQRSGFSPLDIQAGSYLQATREDLLSGQPRAVLKAMLGISEYPVSVIARLDAQHRSGRYWSGQATGRGTSEVHAA